MTIKSPAIGFLRLSWPLKLATILLVGDLIVSLLSLAVTLWLFNIEKEGFYHSTFRFFYVDYEGNLPSWFSSTQLFILAVLFGLFAWRNFSKRSLLSWGLCFMTGIFLVFSLDEAAEIHERIGGLTDLLLPDGDRTSTPFAKTGFWMFLVGLPVVGLLVALTLKLKPLFAGRSELFWAYGMGFVVFLGGALGVETLTNFVPEASLAYVWLVHLEEFMEMVGVTILVWATAELLQSYNFRLTLDPIAESPSPRQGNLLIAEQSQTMRR